MHFSHSPNQIFFDDTFVSHSGGRNEHFGTHEKLSWGVQGNLNWMPGYQLYHCLLKVIAYRMFYQIKSEMDVCASSKVVLASKLVLVSIMVLNSLYIGPEWHLLWCAKQTLKWSRAQKCKYMQTEFVFSLNGFHRKIII